MKIVSKIHLLKINENEVHGGVLGWLWGYLGSCWLKVMSFGRILVGFFLLFRSQMAQDAFKMGSWAVLGSKLGLKMVQNRSQERSETLSSRWSIGSLIFEAIWNEFGSILGFKNPPKMEPSWVQNRSKFGVDLRAVFERISVSFFVEFCTQHNIAEGTHVW